jgi:MSHA pilin protein MshC
MVQVFATFLAGRRRPLAAGFTLPELVVTLVLIGIMAAVIAPRFASRAEFDVFGYTEGTKQALRFAQKSAIAKRRSVCATIAGNSLSFTFGASYGAACSLSLLEPASSKAYVLAAPSGVTISAASFSFDPLGKPSAAQSLSVSGGASTQVIVVEAETGYVH